MTREWKNRLLHLWRRRRFEEDLDEEIRFHLETRAAELRDSGLSERDAWRRARREFGPVARTQEGSRAAWQVRWMADFAADFRLALRSFRRSPVFAATAIASLALGIGATAAIFSMMDAALWRPLPVREPDRLALLALDLERIGLENDLPAPFVPQLLHLPVFDGVLVSTGDGVSFELNGRAERIVAQAVSPNYFQVLGVEPYLGRQFLPDAPWAAEAVLSYRFWKRRFGGDPSVIGRAVRLNTRTFTIVGVSPPSFFGVERGRDYELQIPRLPDGVESRELSLLGGASQSWINVMARLKPGVTALAAQAAVDVQLREFLRTTTLGRFRNAGIQRAHIVSGARGWIEDDLKRFNAPLLTLLALVGLVLLIACANVAGMLLARAAARERELAVRCSIGAGRSRLVRQMLAESLTLSILGALAGLAVTGPAGRILFGFLPQGHVGLVIDIRTEGRVVLFTFAVMLATGLVFGLAPALLATRGNIASSLKSAGAAAAGSRTRGALVSAQVAFSLVLLIATGAFIRTLSSLRPQEYGRSPERVLLFTMKPQPELYSDERLRVLYAELIRRMSDLTGVQSAALARFGPLGSLLAYDRVALPNGGTMHAASDAVTPGFFDAVGIPRIAGRDFTLADRQGAPPVTIINRTLARALFGNADPIGRTMTVPNGKWDGRYQIVGLVADAHYFDPHKPPQPGLWLAADQIGLYMPTLFVRAARPDTGALMAAIRREFDELDTGFPVFNVRTLEVRIRDSLARERMVAQFSAALGALALLMAAVGLYGLLAYAVTRRTREIGIRMALGSRSTGVVWLIARDGLRRVAWGALAGAILSTALARFLPAAPRLGFAPFAAALAVLCAVSAAATIIPAVRASRIDPLRALRVE